MKTTFTSDVSKLQRMDLTNLHFSSRNLRLREICPHPGDQQEEQVCMTLVMPQENKEATIMAEKLEAELNLPFCSEHICAFGNLFTISGNTYFLVSVMITCKIKEYRILIII